MFSRFAVAFAACTLFSAPYAGQIIGIGDAVSGSGAACLGDCRFDQQGQLVAAGDTAELFNFGVEIDPATGDIIGGGGTFQGNQGTLVVGPGGNVDPVQTLAILYTDSGAPTNLIVTLTAPIMPTFPGGSLLTTLADLSGVLYDGDDDGGSVAMGTVLPSGAVYETVIDGLTKFIFGPAVGSTDVGAGGSLAYGPYSVSSLHTCIVDCAFFGIRLGIGGQGGGDQYSLLARHELVAAESIPVPSTLMLCALGLLALRRVRQPA